MEIGQIVYATKGRDAGKYFIIIDMDDKFVYIVDGKTRRLEKPKKKNKSHVKAAKQIIPEIREKLKKSELTDREIQEILSNFNIKNILEGKEV